MSRPQSFVCSRCKGPRDRGLEQRYCGSCHAAYMKEWRAVRRQNRLHAIAQGVSREFCETEEETALQNEKGAP